MRSTRDRREETYLLVQTLLRSEIIRQFRGSGRKMDKATIKDHMITTALHIFSPDINGSALATFR